MNPKLKDKINSALPSRRQIIASGVALGAWVVLPSAVAATEGALAQALQAWTGNAKMQTGKVRLEIAALVENGNVVPITVRVDSPMTEQAWVKSIAVFNEKNPQREVAQFTLGPHAGKAEVSTRIRLATSQQLVAVAQLSDDSYWMHSVDVIVTLAACIE